MAHLKTKITAGVVVGGAILGLTLGSSDQVLDVPFQQEKPTQYYNNYTGQLDEEERERIKILAEEKQQYILIVEYTRPLSYQEYKDAVEEAWGVPIVLVRTLDQPTDRGRSWALSIERELSTRR